MLLSSSSKRDSTERVHVIGSSAERMKIRTMLRQRRVSVESHTLEVGEAHVYYVFFTGRECSARLSWGERDEARLAPRRHRFNDHGDVVWADRHIWVLSRRW